MEEGLIAVLIIGALVALGVVSNKIINQRRAEKRAADDDGIGGGGGKGNDGANAQQ